MHTGHVGELRFEPILTSQEKRELHHEVFRGRVFIGLDLTDADFRGARFEASVIVTCKLARADLRGAELVLCDLRSVDLTGALLGDNDFRGSVFMDVLGLSDADRRLVQESGGSFQQEQASLR